jgi:hypothetical protein
LNEQTHNNEETPHPSQKKNYGVSQSPLVIGKYFIKKEHVEKNKKLKA